jgi:RNA polymerase sigma-70 factor, ECF subfamily
LDHLPGAKGVIDDAALLRAASAGDARAFETFMHAHEAAVHRYLRNAYSHIDLDDALQETFIAAWRGAGTFAGAGNARGWLYAIARNAVRHQTRRHVGEPAHVESIDSLESLAEQAGWGCAADATVLSDAALAREALTAAMAQLPAEEREVLTLRELDGFSGDETAALLHLSLSATKSRLHRARLHLAAVLRHLDPTLVAGAPHA